MQLEEVAPEPDLSYQESKPPTSSEKPAKSPSSARPRFNIVRTLRTVQRWSAYGIASFAGLHLTSTILLPPLSLGMANASFMAARSVYQFESGEYVLVYGCFGLHIASGLALHAIRICRNRADYGTWSWAKPSWVAISGLLLAIASGWHWTTMRLGPLLALGDSSLISLRYASYALQDRPWGSTICMGLLSLLFFVHSIPAACKYWRIKAGRIKQLAAVLFGVTWAAVSLRTLYKQPQVTGWIADQFKSAYLPYMRMIYL